MVKGRDGDPERENKWQDTEADDPIPGPDVKLVGLTPDPDYDATIGRIPVACLLEAKWRQIF